jgi:uncharacterized protein with HEPN domain
VGEAAARVSEATQRKNPEIAWPEITGLRNRLVHGYNDVDFDILWHIIQLDLPPLIATLTAILGRKESGQDQAAT